MRFGRAAFACLAAVAAFASLHVSAAQAQTFSRRVLADWENGNPNFLCAAVGDHMEDNHPHFDDDPDQYTHFYERIILTSAGAKGETDRETAAASVRAMFAADPPYARCSTAGFDLSEGHVLKYAIASAFDDFISDMARWGVVAMNIVDETDGETPLDYVANIIPRKIYDDDGRLTDSPMKPRLQGYYRTMRNAGGFHARELRDGTRDRIERLRATVASAVSGRSASGAIGRHLVDQLNRRRPGTNARLEGTTTVAALTGHACAPELVLDNTGLTIIAGADRAGVGDLGADFRLERATLSWAFGQVSVRAEGDQLVFESDHGRTVIDAPDAAARNRAISAANELRTLCRGRHDG